MVLPSQWAAITGRVRGAFVHNSGLLHLFDLTDNDRVSEGAFGHLQARYAAYLPYRG